MYTVNHASITQVVEKFDENMYLDGAGDDLGRNNALLRRGITGKYGTTDRL